MLGIFFFFFLFDAGIQRPESEEAGGETWIGCEAMSLQDLRSYPGLFGQSRWIDALPMSIPVPNLATKAELREGAQLSLHITLTGRVTGFCASRLSFVTKGQSTALSGGFLRDDLRLSGPTVGVHVALEWFC